MKNQDLNKLFIDELKDMYSSEKQNLKALSQLIKQASLPELKEVLTNHYKETEDQIVRLERIFSLVNLVPSEEKCEGMEGIIAEAIALSANKPKSPSLDAAIISAAQKVEHYEIASYGTLKSFAKHLDLESEIVHLLDQTFNEEVAADRKLTRIAEGSFFAPGVIQEAADSELLTSKYRK